MTAGCVAKTVVAAAAHRLRRDDDVLALDDAGEEATDDTFALAVDVHVRGVDQRAACFDERLELARRVVLVGVTTPCHRAERESRDVEPGRAQPPLLHAPTLSGQRPQGRA